MLIPSAESSVASLKFCVPCLSLIETQGYQSGPGLAIIAWILRELFCFTVNSYITVQKKTSKPRLLSDSTWNPLLWRLIFQGSPQQEHELCLQWSVQWLNSAVLLWHSPQWLSSCRVFKEWVFIQPSIRCALVTLQRSSLRRVGSARRGNTFSSTNWYSWKKPVNCWDKTFHIRPGVGLVITSPLCLFSIC